MFNRQNHQCFVDLCRFQGQLALSESLLGDSCCAFFVILLLFVTFFFPFKTELTAKNFRTFRNGRNIGGGGIS